MNDFQLYFNLGLHHILSWSSYDHILFLFALIMVFYLSEWRKLLTLVSLFTLAHTFSLILSVYGVIKVDENLVEKLILLTIILTALSNILIKNTKLIHQIHYYFSFFFGLVHGLGFASDFKMFIFGHHDKLLPLLEFALGIEIAQIIIGLLILLLIWLILKFTKVKQSELMMLLSGGIVGYILAII